MGDRRPRRGRRAHGRPRCRRRPRCAEPRNAHRPAPRRAPPCWSGGPRRCWLLGAKGDLLFEEAVATEGADEWPFELARTRLAYGERLRRRRRILEARPWLRSALDTFDQLGAKPWADRARTELRAAGVVTEAKPPQAIDDLTPQQMQIVMLAARGLSNRDIADKLFLSPRTVGFHLYNAFPKLQVSTRAQLADVLGDGTDLSSPRCPVPADPAARLRASRVSH